MMAVWKAINWFLAADVCMAFKRLEWKADALEQIIDTAQPREAEHG